MQLADDIQREILMQHSRHPRNEGTLPLPHGRARIANERTGDTVELALRFHADRLHEIAWQASGSAVLKASCSLMSEWAKQRTREALLDGAGQFTRWLRGDGDADGDVFGDAMALAGIRKLPARVACASLPWHTLTAAVVGGSRADSKTAEP